MESRIVSIAAPRGAPRWSSKRAGALALLGLVLLLSGCALNPWRKSPAPTEPPPPSVEIPATQNPQPPPPEEVTAPAQAPVSPGSGRRTPQSSLREAVPDTTQVSPPPAAPSATPGGPVLLQLTDDERSRLTEEMYRDLAVTNVCLRRINPSRLTRERSQTLSDVQDLLTSVEKARADNDVQAAARLARKARLLAEDLAKR